jgi:hypothetical protein
LIHHDLGIDPMVLDLAEPGHLAQLHYRLEELSIKYSRALVGIVIISEDRKGKRVPELDRLELHAKYQQQLQGPIRLIQVGSSPESFPDHS